MQPWSATFKTVATNPCMACMLLSAALPLFPNTNQKSLSHLQFLQFLKFSNKYRPLESGKKVAIKISCHICGNELFSPDKWLFVFLQLGTRSSLSLSLHDVEDGTWRRDRGALFGHLLAASRLDWSWFLKPPPDSPPPLRLPSSSHV